MLLADTLSHYAPQNGPEVALDITIHHVHIIPEKKLKFQETIQDDPLLLSLAEHDIVSTGQASIKISNAQ